MESLLCYLDTAMDIAGAVGAGICTVLALLEA